MSFDQLPWETKPQTLKNDFKIIEWNGGTLKIPRYGYLDVDEMTELAKVDSKSAIYSLTIKKAAEFSKVVDLSPRYCWAFLTKILGLELGQPVNLTEEEETLKIVNHAFIREYLDEIRLTQIRIMIRAAHTMIQRIKPDWPEDKTRKLPEPLLRLIYDFHQEEEKGPEKPSDPEEDARALDEALGKLEEVSQSIATAQTGKKPTGNAKDSGPATLHSPAKVSDASQASTSSKRSSKVTRPKENGFTAKN